MLSSINFTSLRKRIKQPLPVGAKKVKLALLGDKAKIIFCNFTGEDDRVFGQYASKVEQSFIFQLRKFNFQLQEYAAATAGVFICDLSTIQNTMGRNLFWSPAVYTNTEMVISIDALPYVAQSVVQMIDALLGRFKKCVILDLDKHHFGRHRNRASRHRQSVLPVIPRLTNPVCGNSTLRATKKSRHTSNKNKMEKTEILQKIQSVFRDILDDKSITLKNETTASDVEGWDSLTHIQLIVAIEKGFKIKFASREILSWKNVGEMVDCISQK
ncbi:MAG: phosphopantetheine-binding protein [Dysgonamonadaceae bacterium]|jgi:acyl carrier protein|nr:phosphopantetheine-binding protein [Dysgonamonadaceae bacterium]